MTDETNGSGVGEREGLLALARERAGGPVPPGCAAFTDRAFWLRFTDEVAVYFTRAATPDADDADFHEHDAAGCLDCDCASAPMNSAPCTCACEHATTEFLNDVAGWCCSHCGASVDPDAPAASTDASGALSEAERVTLNLGIDEAETCVCCGADYGSKHVYAAVERIVAARESAAVTRARAEGSELRARMESLADEFDAKGRRGSAHFGADVGDTIRLWIDRDPRAPRSES